MLIWIGLFVFVGLCMSHFADKFLTKHHEAKLGGMATAVFIFAWPIAVIMIIYFMIQTARGKYDA
jgi:hypothetical protein